jgi:host factor-I protein
MLLLLLRWASGATVRSARNARSAVIGRTGLIAAIEWIAVNRSSPPEQTNAENFYYQKQMQARTSMVIVLRDGEQIHGVIEWYDRSCIKVNRNGGANLLIYKPAIKYMFKEGENIRK